ncbi:barstar family protein [Streptomyces hydrogenans]|uniref:barstar family protein n=1 Tax=Streptomyces hydrogenans TaxID=1873719 RepID=UPI003329AC63
MLRRQLGALEGRGGRVYDFQARDLRREEDVFRVFAERLEFPSYFGWNWDAMVDCLDDLCGEVTGGVGIAGVIHGADSLIDSDGLELFVSVLCQGAARANSDVDLDGDPLDRPAISQHFVFLLDGRDAVEFTGKVDHPDLTVVEDEGFVTVTLNPEVWFA